MLRDESPTVRTMPQSTPIEDAIFMGWQKTGSGKVFALYNIKAAGHPSRGSTVTGSTLLKLNLHVPEVALPQQPVESPGGAFATFRRHATLPRVHRLR
jgi:hypothetical protein